MKKTIASVHTCTGCGACENLCPHKAISMRPNAEGFLYPSIDADTCSACGLCYDRCPAEHPHYPHSARPACYVAAASDELRKESSSGAIFPLLAEHILGLGGSVCGAAWTPDNLVEHIIISDKADLHKLKSSKYLQSRINDIYQQIRQKLHSGKPVLFSGAPCQVAGLNAYLGKAYDNLLTVDIVCHGVPSPAVYKKYLEELVPNKDEKVLKTDFRDKRRGWGSALNTITTYTTAATYSFPAGEDPFMLAFLKNFCLRDSCSRCPFAKLPRQGDITLGDFWGIDRYNATLNDKKGLSLVLLNTPKGEKHMQAIKGQTILCEQAPIKCAIKGNPSLVRPAAPHKKRADFFANLDSISLNRYFNLSKEDTCDCAILNFWYTNNYGALLTCYALQETLRARGKSTKVINYIPPSYHKKIKNSLSSHFADRRLNLTHLCTSKADLQQLNDRVGAFIVGSDQVWRHPYFWNQGGNIFQLNFARSNKKKIACAASFGTDHFEGSAEDTLLTKFYMQQFDSISVREADGVHICRRTFGVDATHILDPVFFAPQGTWDRLVQRSSLAEKNFIAFYVLDKSPTSAQILHTIKERFRGANKAEIGKGAGKRKRKLSVEDWIYTIKHCDFFVTDSFHGSCFAIIFNKPFICIANTSRGYSRFKSLFSTFGLEERCIDSAHADIEALLSKAIDWESVNRTLEQEARRSQEWLSAALDSPAKEENVTLDIIDTLLSAQETLKNQPSPIARLWRKALRLFTRRG